MTRALYAGLSGNYQTTIKRLSPSDYAAHTRAVTPGHTDTASPAQDRWGLLRAWEPCSPSGGLA